MEVITCSSGSCLIPEMSPSALRAAVVEVVSEIEQAVSAATLADSFETLMIDMESNCAE